MKKAPNRRKVLLINPRFQLTMMGLSLGTLLIVVLQYYWANYYFINQILSMGKEAGLPKDHIFFEFLMFQNESLLYYFFISSAIVAFLLFFGGLYLSHRISGPLYRFCKHLEQCTEEKNNAHVSFRKGDFFPEVAKKFNDYVDTLK